MRKWKRKIITIALSFGLCMGMAGQNCMNFPVAANVLAKTVLNEGENVTQLETDKIYKNFDFTGDGKKDSFEYEVKNDTGESEATVYISGKCMGTVPLLRGGSGYSCQVDKDTNILFFTCWQFGANIATAYTCDGKKLKQLDTNFEKYSLDYIQPYAAEDGTIFMITKTGKHDRMVDLATEQAYFLMEYEYEDGKISLASHYANAVGNTEYGAKASFSTSSSPDKDNKKGVYVEKGDKVEVLQYYFDDDNRKIQVKVNGDTGWATFGDDFILEELQEEKSTDNSTTYQDELKMIMNEYISNSDDEDGAKYYYSWSDDLLNGLYQDIKSNLSSSKFKALKADEKKWITQKERDAKTAASNSSDYDVAYYFSATQSTIERCQYLIDNYEGYYSDTITSYLP